MLAAIYTGIRRLLRHVTGIAGHWNNHTDLEQLEARVLLAARFTAGPFVTYGLTAMVDEPHVAVDAQGNFVAVWASDAGAVEQILAQRFNHAGTPVGSVIEVTDVADGSGTTPQVAMDPAGDFVVTWHNGVRRYAADGTPVGSASTTGAPDLYDPAPVAMDAQGNYAVIAGNSLQRFDSAGNASGSPITLPTSNGTDLAMNSSGNFIACWIGAGVFVQTFSAGGAATSAAIQVNQPASGSTAYLAYVSMNDNGTFAVTWNSNDPAHRGVWTQFFAADATPIGTNVQVTATGYVLNKSVVVQSDGSFAIAWETTSGVFASTFDSTGALTINAATIAASTTNRKGVSLGAMPSGNIVAVWGEYPSPGNPSTGTITGSIFHPTFTNNLPTASAISGSLWQDTTLTFTNAQFTTAFSDADTSDSLEKIKIALLPAHGALKLNGVAVTANQEIATNQLSFLAYTPNPAYVGQDSFTFIASDGLAYAAGPATVTLTVSRNTDPHSPNYLSPIAPTAGNLASFFDAAYYLLHNPDVATSVNNHQITALQHFQMFGQFEGRAPSTFYNESYYLSHNPDVAQAVAHHTLADGFQHFMNYGYLESRAASSTPGTGTGYVSHLSPKSGVAAGFFDEAYYLSRYPDVRHAVLTHQIASGLAHFLAFGQNEGRRPSSLYDEAYYLAHNADVATAVASHSLPSGFAHFLFYGFAEGRVGSAVVAS